MFLRVSRIQARMAFTFSALCTGRVPKRATILLSFTTTGAWQQPLHEDHDIVEYIGLFLQDPFFYYYSTWHFIYLGQLLHGLSTAGHVHSSSDFVNFDTDLSFPPTYRIIA